MNTSRDFKGAVEEITDQLNPMEHLQSLNFPRRAGTEGDRRAASYIAQVLEQMGLEPSVEAFHFEKPKALSRLLILLVVTLWAVLSLANVQVLEMNWIVSLLVIALPVAFLLAFLNLRSVFKFFMRRLRNSLQKVEDQLAKGELAQNQMISSQNVIAELGPGDAENHILFTAHFDSISSAIPMRLTMGAAVVGLLGLMLYGALYLLNILTSAFIDINFFSVYLPLFAVFAVFVLAGVWIIMLGRLWRGNESHGVIDDGTGVAILLELARYLKANPVPGYKFTFGFFSAEEAGLIGAAAYYSKGILDKNKTRVISVDMIGEKPPLGYVKGIFPLRRLSMEPTFNNEIAALAQALDIEIEAKSFPYPGSDFGHFLVDGGFKTNWFISGSDLIHTKRDHLGNVNEALVNDAMQLIVAYFVQANERAGTQEALERVGP